MTDKPQLVLSLFPGIGLLDMAFEQEGFTVVRGPDVLWGGDIRNFHPPAGRFDGVIGGPPCQCFSRLSAMVRHNGYEPKFGNLIPEFERCVAEASPDWFLMEEVPDAPTPWVDGYTPWSCLLNNRQLGEAQNRLRRWTFGVRGIQHKVLMIETSCFESAEWKPAVTASEAAHGMPLGTRSKMGRGKSYTCRSWPEFIAAQGLPEDYDLPFKRSENYRAVGNGVPLPMGRAIAKAVREAIK